MCALEELVLGELMVKLGVVGVGHIGHYHAEKYSQLSDVVDLVAVCDIDQTRADDFARKFATTPVYDYKDLARMVDAVSITVPTMLHFEVAKYFIVNGVHVLLEKPMTCTLDEADELIYLANKHGVVLQIGHLERFNSVIQALEGELLDPRFIESARLSTFHLRGTDVNVALDLMIHDIDIIQSLVKSPVSRIAANGAAVLTPYIDIANARIEFANGCVANVTASRISAKVERSMQIFQHDGYFALNLKDKSLVEHRKGEKEMYPGIPEMLRTGRNFAESDALYQQCKSFVKAINGGKVTVTGQDGRDALKVAIDITHIVHQSDGWCQSFLARKRAASGLKVVGA
jgi:predicted dehydrogenase